MTYISTRGQAPAADFRTALLNGIAPDGGLYMPSDWPIFHARRVAELAGEPFSTAAAAIIKPFVGDWLSDAQLGEMTARAFASFTHPDVAPLVRIGEEDWLLELFHGPTLAFKDVAMQVLGEFFEHALTETGRRVTIVGATSGDTGGAAIEAFRGKERVRVVILHPAGRVSDVQRRMMTTPVEPNIHNIAVRGTFDDCQRIVKEILSDVDFCASLGVSAVNSINWARLAIQSVYYFTALNALRKETGAERASFCVPTGNFGDVFAGYAAKKMGAGVDTLCVSVNRNDILRRALETGRYEPMTAHATTSPSMDIQVASNFERLIFEAAGRDASRVNSLMEALSRNGAFDLPDDVLEAMRKDFFSMRIDEEENAATIRSIYAEQGMLIDPHSAVAVASARRARKEGLLSGPAISLATAHPAKFPDAVFAGAGARPDLPAHLRGLLDRPERFVEASPETAAVREIILEGAA